MLISDWSSDVCSSDLDGLHYEAYAALAEAEGERVLSEALERFDILDARCVHRTGDLVIGDIAVWVGVTAAHRDAAFAACRHIIDEVRSEEHTSELQSLMRISYAVFCLKQTKNKNKQTDTPTIKHHSLIHLSHTTTLLQT